LAITVSEGATYSGEKVKEAGGGSFRIPSRTDADRVRDRYAHRDAEVISARDAIRAQWTYVHWAATR
jgi:hypothetical protein